MTSTSDAELLERVRARYAAAADAVTAGRAAGCGTDSAAGSALSVYCASRDSGTSNSQEGASCCGPAAEAQAELDATFGASLYDAEERSEVPADALAASLGCGNPLAVADLHPGDRVLDLGSGGGIDVLLSARRVGAAGFAYGVDMTDEMLELARANAAKAGVTNVEFVKGAIEDIPLPDASVDVVISNCVINLSVDKAAVLAEMFRVLTPGGRIGVSDVVAEDHLSQDDRTARGSYVGCIAGALSRTEYLDGLSAAGFTDFSVAFTHQAADGMHAAIIRATKPTGDGDRP